MRITCEIHKKSMYFSCITHVIHMYLGQKRIKIRNSKSSKNSKYIWNTCKIHVIYMRFPFPDPIFNVFLMYFKKNQCIFRLREIGKKWHVFFMYFSCIFNVFIIFVRNMHKKSMYFSCISHVFLMYSNNY